MNWREPRHVAYYPLNPRRYDTAAGPAVVDAGVGFEQVVITATAPAARHLADLIFVGIHQATQIDRDPWSRLAGDLMVSAGQLDPSLVPAIAAIPRLSSDQLRAIASPGRPS